jgi:hypothetical protein
MLSALVRGIRRSDPSSRMALDGPKVSFLSLVQSLAKGRQDSWGRSMMGIKAFMYTSSRFFWFWFNFLDMDVLQDVE